MAVNVVEWGEMRAGLELTSAVGLKAPVPLQTRVGVARQARGCWLAFFFAGGSVPAPSTLVLSVFLAAAGAADAKGDGWRPLFEGTDQTGWTSAPGQRPGKGWVVEDGDRVAPC